MQRPRCYSTLHFVAEKDGSSFENPRVDESAALGSMQFPSFFINL